MEKEIALFISHVLLIP